MTRILYLVFYGCTRISFARAREAGGTALTFASVFIHREISDQIMKGRDRMNIFENRDNLIGAFEPERTKNSV